MRFQCEQCDVNFSRAHSLRGHIRAVHQGQMIMCNQCDHKTTNKTGLKEHLRSKHGAEKLRCDITRIQEDKKYYRDHSDYTNIYVTLLTEHIERKHSKTQNIKCDKCN